MQALARLVPSGGSGGEFIPSLSPRFSWLPTTLAVFGLWMLHSNLCLRPHMAVSPPCVSVSLKTPSAFLL